MGDETYNSIGALMDHIQDSVQERTKAHQQYHKVFSYFTEANPNISNPVTGGTKTQMAVNGLIPWIRQ